VPVMVTTPVVNSVSTCIGPTARTGDCNTSPASGSAVSAPAMSLPSGSIWTGLPTMPRTTSGCDFGGTIWVSDGSRTLMLNWPSLCPPRPSLTAYAMERGPGSTGASAVTCPRPSIIEVASVARGLMLSFSASRQSARTGTERRLPATTG